MTEFNFIGSPTTFINRTNAEHLLGTHWTGWTMRYFDILDTMINPELPHWVVYLYKKQHNNKWQFKSSGIVFHHEPDDILEILDGKEDLSVETPIILTNSKAQTEYNLPSQIYYPYWFDYTDTLGNKNEIIAKFKLYTTNKGDSILRKYGLPNEMPAIIKHKKQDDYTFYYFCGDFADNPIDHLTSYFKGIKLIDYTFYSDKPNDRAEFFWKYYYYLLSTILNQYYTQINHKNK